MRRRRYDFPIGATASYVRERQEYKENPDGDLIGSRVVNGLKGQTLHMPVIDLDFDCELVPSSTPGHFHLYLNRPLTWEQYQSLLIGLSLAKLIEPGWYDAAMVQEETFVRAPGVMKEWEEIRDKIRKTGTLFPESEHVSPKRGWFRKKRS